MNACASRKETPNASASPSHPIKPAIAFNAVLLPAPFAPIKPVTPPCLTAKLTPSSKKDGSLGKLLYAKRVHFFSLPSALTALKKVSIYE